MTIAVHVSVEGVRIPLARARVSDTARRVLEAERVRDAMLSITFLRTRAMAALNRRHLGHRGATDVIAFGLGRSTASGPVVGDIYVAPDVARANALAHGSSVREELTRLIVHGVLHVLGYDHASDESRVASPMWKRQERLVTRVMKGAAA
jgi:probable rRNA maturation factor